MYSWKRNRSKNYNPLKNREDGDRNKDKLTITFLKRRIEDNVKTTENNTGKKMH